MILNIHNGKLIVQEEAHESFLELQDKSSYNLCPAFGRSKSGYEIPFVAFPVVLELARRIGYAIHLTPSLREFYQMMKAKRQELESIKDGRFPDNPETNKIRDYLTKFQTDTGVILSKGQIETIIFCLIGKCVLVANGVGTGKTLIANSVGRYLLDNKKAMKVVILTPASLAKNFYVDYKKFFTDRGVMLVRDVKKTTREEKYKQFMALPEMEFLITNYEKCLFDYEMIKKLKPDVLITDEFHYMKNFFSAQRSVNFFEMIKEWNPEYRFTLSGTPIENKLFDLYPVFKMLDGGVTLGGQNFFNQNFIEYETNTFRIRTKHGKTMLRSEEKATGFKNIEFLKILVRPYIIRKTLDLPVGKYVQDIMIDMPTKMQDAYQQLFRKELSTSAKYHSCRQFLCDTRREDYHDNPKIEQLDNIIDQATDKIIIFSFYKCSLDAISEHLKYRNIKHMLVSGDTTEDATTAVQRFTNDPNMKILICTDKINYGQNIQCAKILINWELPLKPTTIIQRIGRIYRTGQDKDVHIYNFVIADSIEEIIQQAFENKKEIIKAMIENLDVRENEDVSKEIEQEVMQKFLSKNG